MKLFSDSLPFYKANFHCHTTMSDGHLTPAECMRFYHERGYEVLSITDHRSVTIPCDPPEGLLMIPGLELDYADSLNCAHILGLNVRADIEEKWKRGTPPQETIDLIHSCGGTAILAHPAWSLNSPQFLMSLAHVDGVEIYNSVSTLPTNADRADSSNLLDIAWSSGLTLWPVLGNDDSHQYYPVGGVAATMIQAAEKTPESLLAALRNGAVYATQGPRFRQIEIIGEEVVVTCSPVHAVVFCSNLTYTAGRVVLGSNLTRASYRIKASERFLRIELHDETGKRAWSTPIALR